MKAIFGKPVQTDVDMSHAQLTRTEEMAFHEKYHVLMNHSQDPKIGPVLQGSATFLALRTGLKLKFFRGPAFKNHKCSAMNVYYNSCKLLLL